MPSPLPRLIPRSQKASLIIASFLLNAGLVLSGGTPTEFAWPIFLAGLAIGMSAAWLALRPARR